MPKASTSNTPDAHTIVVGGGIMGLGIAWELALLGDRVTVVDKGELGRAASWAAAGMLAPYAEADFFEDELLELGVHSLGLWRAFVARLQVASGVTIDFDEAGALLVAYDRDDEAQLRRRFEYMQRLQLPVQWLHGDAVRELEPMLSPYLPGGIRCDDDLRVNNRDVVRALQLAGAKAGVEFRTGVEVSAVVRRNDKVVGVQTDAGVLEAERVVIAAGAWSRSIAGVPHSLPIRPVKGQMLSVRTPDPCPLTRVVRSPRTYLVPRSDGTMVVGATSEEQGFDDTLTAGGVYELLKGAYEVLPIVYEMPIVEMWTGFRPCSRDNAPMIGPADLAGLFVATGHYRNGIQQAPATIAGLVETMQSGSVPAFLKPFAVNRFARRKK